MTLGPAERDTTALVVAKKRILFVDDEATFLVSLQYLLRTDRERWHMVFALGGPRGIDEVRNQHFDLVVSDLQMPGIDGTTLLSVIKRESPAMAHVVFAGHADREKISRSVPELGEVLTKPWEVAALCAAIERSLDGAELLRHRETERGTAR